MTDKRVNDLLAKMTLTEKIGQLNQYSAFWDATGPAPSDVSSKKKYQNLKDGLVGAMLNVKGVKNIRELQRIAVEETRLGIPLLFGFDVIHGYRTISPIPLAEAASWDLQAIQKSAEIAAEEAAAAGINWTFAPMVDISRDPRWGRVMEGAGEDPFLGSKIAEARIKGFQGDLSSKKNIIACAKHFAGYGFVEAGKEYNTVDVSNHTIQNVIFPPFKAAVKAGVRSFMTSFTQLNGVPATGNRYLQRDVLKKEWDFGGFVVSDWGSINELATHGFAKDSLQAAEIAINAGTDMDMESGVYMKFLNDLVKAGKVKETTLDDAVRRILKVKFELGLFDNPYKYCDEVHEKATLGKSEFQEGVLDIAKKSIVLLKNEGNLLPLKKQGQRLALIGALAADKNSPLGNWRLAAEDNTAISVLEGLKRYNGNELVYAKGTDVVIGATRFSKEVQVNTTDKSEFSLAIEEAKNADVVIMVLGENGYQSGEGRSRTDIGLPGVQQELLEAVYAVNRNVVLVLNNGRPLAFPWAADHIPAIVEAWQLGSQSGNAIAQVLYGDYNPSGKLPMTFPRSIGQVPLYYNHQSTGRPVAEKDMNVVFWSHYSDQMTKPLFPFGYGLSYSKFEYSNLKLSKTSLSRNEKLVASVTLKNNSKVAGKEIVQWYIQDLVGSVARPVKELKGFEVVELKPFETKEIQFTIDEKILEFYNLNERWESEAGEFRIFVGGNSEETIATNFYFLK